MPDLQDCSPVYASSEVPSILLDMPARCASNNGTIDALTESGDRLNAMAIIHAKLDEGVCV
ncbi:MAG: hypothetical protein U9N36_03820 [Euryarchaeota archaeon]|nr:hypothetical protein [Euryarchaeota archaeon]